MGLRLGALLYSVVFFFCFFLIGAVCFSFAYSSPSPLTAVVFLRQRPVIFELLKEVLCVMSRHWVCVGLKG